MVVTRSRSATLAAQADKTVVGFPTSGTGHHQASHKRCLEHFETTASRDPSKRSRLHLCARTIARRATCGICFEDFTLERRPLTSCSHSFCSACVAEYVRSKLRERKYPIRCPGPGCPVLLSTTACIMLLDNPEEVELLTQLEVEAAIPDEQKFYCPNPTCSTLMVLEEPQKDQPTSCPVCKFLLCTSCRALWHSNMTCDQFQAGSGDAAQTEDRQMLVLAEETKWRRCPQCRQMIELAHGCYHITCKCGHHFCYKCGLSYSGTQKVCSCVLWDDENMLLEERFRHAVGGDAVRHWHQFRQDHGLVNQAVAALHVRHVAAAAAVHVQALPPPIALLQHWFPGAAAAGARPLPWFPAYAPQPLAAVAAVGAVAPVGGFGAVPPLMPAGIPVAPAVVPAYGAVQLFHALPFMQYYGVLHHPRL